MSDLAAAIAKENNQPWVLDQQKRQDKNVALESRVDQDEYALSLWQEVLAKAARTIIGATSVPDSVLDPLARGAIDSLLSGDVGRGRSGPNSGAQLLRKVSGDPASIEPGTAGAARYLTLFLNESVEAWMRGVIVEFVTEFMPKIAGIGGGIESVQALQDIIEGALGGGRMVRRVLQPFVQATAITPAQWHVNKQYRPELLSAGAAIEAHLAGRWTREQLGEELARQGWSDARIDAQVENAKKRLSFGDLVELWARGGVDRNVIVARAQALGYDAATAEELLELAIAKRRDKLKDQALDAAVAAYIARDITEAQLRDFAQQLTPYPADVTMIVSIARTRRELRTRSLSAADARRLAQKKILSVVDFRRALEREGYEPEAVAALELELRQELQADADLEAARRQKAADDAAEKAQREQERQARARELEERRALPALQVYHSAYVRGLIPRDRLAAAILREKIAIGDDDLQLLLADADADRAERLEQLERRAAAELKAADQVLPLAAIETAVLKDILSIDRYQAELRQRGFDDAEQAVYVALLRDRLAQRDEARAEQRRAAERADVAGVNLAAFERAVRLGLRSLDEYAQLLERTGTPEFARALTIDLLRAALRDDAAARNARAARDAEAQARSIDLPLRRRAVIAGVLERGTYEAALRDAGWPAEEQLLELQLLDVELAERAAAEARRRRVEEETEARRRAREEEERRRADREAAPPPAPTLSLAQRERAVKLGLLEPAALRAWLVEQRYSPEDVELLVGLVVAGVPDARQAEQREAAIAVELAARQVSLADLQRAVLRGFRTLDQYAARLRDEGYGDDDVLLLRQLLEDRKALEQGRLEKAVAARLAKADDAPTLEQLLAAVTDGTIDGQELVDVLASFGVDRSTALLLARLLVVFGLEA